MLAYKAFNKNLQANMGRGIFQFEPGKTYEEKECKCARNGFHCAENPLCTMDYYKGKDTRFFLVKAEGDINQDGSGSRISCTRITLVKELSRIKLAAHACRYMQAYPDREMESDHAVKDQGECLTEGDFLIVRGKHPKAAGVKGSYLFLVKEKKGSKEIEGIYAAFIDNREFKENTWYGIRGDKICRKKN